MAGYVIVTGASKGIGKEICRELAKRKQDLVLVARSADLLEALAAELKDAHEIDAVPMSVDLINLEAIDRMAAELDKRGIAVSGLVNNAGFGTIGRFEKIETETEDRMIDLNVRALAHLCHLYVPRLKAARGGYVMNIASIAGFTPMPLMATYAAAKAFVLSLSKALAVECEESGVQICCICPGVTETEFIEVQGADTSKLPASIKETPESVARFAMAELDKGSTVAVSGALNRIGRVLMTVIPDDTLARITYLYAKPASRKKKD